MSKWERVTIKKLADVNYGYTTKASFEKDGPQFLRITDIQNGAVDWDKVPFCEIDPIDHEKHRLKLHDIVFARTGATTGKSYLITDPPDAVAASYLIRLRLKDARISPHFLSLYFDTAEYWEKIGAGMSGSAQGGFNASKLGNLPIPVPPLAEQERIVAVLDQAFEAIAAATAHTQQKLHNTQEVFQSTLQSAFSRKDECGTQNDGWVETTLDQLCSIKHGFAFKSQNFRTEGELVVLTPGNFYEEGGYRDRGDKTKYYEGDFPEDFLLSKDAFLIAMTEQAVGLLGSSIIVPEHGKFLHNQRLGLVQVKDGVEWDNHFFFHQFNTQRFRDAVQESASGAKVRHTSPKKLGAITVVVPPLATQRTIVAKLDALSAETRRLESLYQRQLQAYTELKQSLLHQAFTGEL